VSEPNRIYVTSGQLFCGDGSHVASTVLGSCVAVCLWDPKRRHGGMIHYLLPSWNGAGPKLNYGDTAIARLVEEMEAAGSPRKNLKAVLVGGAAVLGLTGQTVGDRNAAVAEDMLKKLGIPVVGSCLGGREGRTVAFSVANGNVRLRKLG